MYSIVQACRQWKHYIFGKEMVIHTDHWPLQFIQTQGKLQNDRHQKWSTYLQQFHLNIKYKKGSTNNVADCLSRPPIMVLTTVLNSCGHETSDWLLLYTSDPEFGHTYNTLLGGKASSQFSPPGCPALSLGTPLCSFKRACQDDLGGALQSSRWAFRGRENRGSTAKVFLLVEPSTRCREVHQVLTLLVPLPNRPSRIKASILHFLPPVDLGNPSLWITCQAFLLLSMAMTVFLWSSTNS
jgi:hypothetical protein